VGLFVWAAFWVALVFGLIAHELSFRAAAILAALWFGGFVGMVGLGVLGGEAGLGAARGFGMAFHAILAIVAFLMAFKRDVRIR
jgi:hypothetical protein